MTHTKQTSIVSKMAFSIIVLIATGMSILGLFITSYQTQTLQSQMEEFGKTVVQQLAEISMEPLLSKDTLGLRVVVNRIIKNDTVIGAAIYSDEGDRLAHSGYLPEQNLQTIYGTAKHLTKRYYQFEWSREGETTQHFADTVSFLCPIKYRNITTGHALVSFNYRNLYQAKTHSIKMITITTALLILVTALIAFSISRRMAKPIQDLMEATKKMDNGNYHYQITERRNDEIGELMNTFNHMSQGLLEKSQVERVFSQFVSSDVAEEMLKNINKVELGGKKVNATVLFADIVGFTNISEELPPEQVAEMLNECFSYIDKAGYYYRGTIDKFMGDCAMVVFGAPNEDIEHRFHAIVCSLMIQKLAELVNERRLSQGKPAVHLRIGINSGEMLAGNLGSRDRMQYTVVGDAVNLASRLASVAQGGEIIIAESLLTHPDVRGRLSAKLKESIQLRGIKHPVNTYVVQDIAMVYRSILENNIQKIFSNELQSTDTPEAISSTSKIKNNS
ncbi:MAG: HAMP domain-containing protein [Pseudomonadales bacterium]|nr:HAMP domain-containing protein [Pseudomonadales bacterium]